MSGPDHAPESELSASDVGRQPNLSRGDNSEMRTSGDEGEEDEDHLSPSEASDTEKNGGRTNRHSGRDELHA